MAEQEFTTQELESEEWRSVVGYEGTYSISSLGRIRRETTNRNAKAGHILKPRHDRHYLYVSLCVNGKITTRRIHTMVALAFIGPRPQGHQINHIDTNKQNNRATNFEYLTPKGNTNHARDHGLLSRGIKHGQRVRETTPRGDDHYARRQPEKLCRGQRHGMAKITDQEVPHIRRLIAAGVNSVEIARRFGVTKHLIRDIRRGRTWCHVP